MPNGDFGDFLRNERLSRDVTLEDVEARSKIGRHLLEHLERNDLSRWPRERFYKEHLLRGYAAAVGLDPHQVVARFRLEFPVADSGQPPVGAPVRSRLWLAISAFAGAMLIVLMVFVAVDRQSAASEATGTPVQGTPAQGSFEAAQLRLEPAAPPLVGATSKKFQSALGIELPEMEQPGPAVEEIEGELTVTSTPPGVHVTVNGIGRGETPVRVQFLPAGTYTIRFVESGYPITERRVTITPARPRARVSATLRQLD